MGWNWRPNRLTERNKERERGSKRLIEMNVTPFTPVIYVNTCIDRRISTQMKYSRKLNFQIGCTNMRAIYASDTSQCQLNVQHIVKILRKRVLWTRLNSVLTIQTHKQLTWSSLSCVSLCACVCCVQLLMKNLYIA